MLILRWKCTYLLWISGVESVNNQHSPLKSQNVFSLQDGAPLYGTTHNLCNKVYNDAGKCNQYLAYNVDDDGVSFKWHVFTNWNGFAVHYVATCETKFDHTFSKQSGSYSEDEISCKYIENIRHGVYDESGEIYSSSSSQSGNMNTEVTSDQKVFLALTALSCILLSLYSCYLHHEITNLLLHKLSYQGALGPSLSYPSKRRGDVDSRIDDYHSYVSDSFSYAWVLLAQYLLHSTFCILSNVRLFRIEPKFITFNIFVPKIRLYRDSASHLVSITHQSCFIFFLGAFAYTI